MRGRDADKFWFSFFHEIGHVLMGHISKPFGTTSEDEMCADQFAEEILIPTDVFEEFVDLKDFSAKAITEFAERIGILDSIVVGRLQKEGLIGHNQHNGLKTKYAMSA